MTKARVFGDPTRPGFALPFLTNYASKVSPIDEAKMFPMLHKFYTEAMPASAFRSYMADSVVQHNVIQDAHDNFMYCTDPDASDAQSQLRMEMREHLSLQLGADLFEADRMAPRSRFEAFVMRIVDALFPHRVDAREQAAADLRVETMVAKHTMADYSVVNAMLVQAFRRSRKKLH